MLITITMPNMGQANVFPRFRLHQVALNSDWFIALFTFAMIGLKINRMKMMNTAKILYVDNNNNA